MTEKGGLFARPNFRDALSTGLVQCGAQPLGVALTTANHHAGWET